MRGYQFPGFITEGLTVYVTFEKAMTYSSVKDKACTYLGENIEKAFS